jgi:hypothetical protein
MREPIRGQYLVMLENEHGVNVSAAAAALTHRYGGKIDREFHAASTGFAITMTDGQALGVCAPETKLGGCDVFERSVPGGWLLGMA